MRNLIIGIIIGFLAGAASIAMAKYESGSNDAESVVAYGNNNGTIVRLLVDSNGNLVGE